MVPLGCRYSGHWGHLAWPLMSFPYIISLSPDSLSILAMKPDPATSRDFWELLENNYRRTSPTISANRAGGEQRALLSDEVIPEWSRYTHLWHIKRHPDQKQRSEMSSLQSSGLFQASCWFGGATIAYRCCGCKLTRDLRNSHFPFFLFLCVRGYCLADVLCVDK